uniref:Secreted protein n=1 Tax=Plectus sambesii TaxID=2011161 RepID=A0A914WAU1_9BILA
MKAVIVIALCVVAAIAQPQGPRGAPGCPTQFGVTDEQCKSVAMCLKTEMDAGRLQKPAPGASLEAFKQVVRGCSDKAGVSREIQAAVEASLPPPPPQQG